MIPEKQKGGQKKGEMKGQTYIFCLNEPISPLLTQRFLSFLSFMLFCFHLSPSSDTWICPLILSGPMFILNTEPQAGPGDSGIPWWSVSGEDRFNGNTPFVLPPWRSLNLLRSRDYKRLSRRWNRKYEALLVAEADSETRSWSLNGGGWICFCSSTSCVAFSRT